MDRRFPRSDWTVGLLGAALACALLVMPGCGSESEPTTKTTTKTTITIGDGTPPSDDGAVDGADSIDPATDSDAPVPAVIGKAIKAFEATDTDGVQFRSNMNGYTQADAESAVLAAANQSDLTMASEVSKASDDAAAFVNRASRPFGLVASDEAAEDMQTLGDVATWIMKGKDQPIVYMVWSQRCPTSIKLNDKMHEVAQETGVRLFAVASNFNDKPAHFEQYREKMGFHFRIFHDPSQQIADILGGKKTPHFMLIDADGVLRYRGAIDNDVNGMKDDEDREDWLLDAIAAVRSGKDVEQADMPAFG